MKKLWTRAQVLAVLSVVAMSLSGCKEGKSLSGQANTENGSLQKAPLPDEPNVTFRDLEGHDVTLTSMKGKVILVNFWATWCDPCRIEIPWMMEFQRKYASRGFTMLGVAMDDEGKSVVEPFVATTHFDMNGQPTTMNYPIVLGNDDIASKFGGLFGLPTSILITRDGKIQKKYIGLVSEDTLEQQIKALL